MSRGRGKEVRSTNTRTLPLHTQTHTDTQRDRNSLSPAPLVSAGWSTRQSTSSSSTARPSGLVSPLKSLTATSRPSAAVHAARYTSPEAPSPSFSPSSRSSKETSGRGPCCHHGGDREGEEEGGGGAVQLVARAAEARAAEGEPGQGGGLRCVVFMCVHVMRQGPRRIHLIKRFLEGKKQEKVPYPGAGAPPRAPGCTLRGRAPGPPSAACSPAGTGGRVF